MKRIEHLAVFTLMFLAMTSATFAQDSSAAAKSTTQQELCAQVQNQENLLLFGNPGAGKSHLLCALAHELIAQGRRMKYTSCAMLVQDLLVAKRDLRLSKEIKKLSRHDGLIIDEMG